MGWLGAIAVAIAWCGTEGFPAEPPAGGAAQLPEPIPFDSLTDARYRDTAKRLAAALATDDTLAFRALHTDAGWQQADDWWKSLLANQKRTFGRVVRVDGIALFGMNASSGSPHSARRSRRSRRCAVTKYLPFATGSRAITCCSAAAWIDSSDCVPA